MTGISENVLEVKNLTISFSTHEGEIHAVRDVSFSVSRGEVVAIVGESGSGKSVTAQALMGLTPIPPGVIKSGSVSLVGTDILTASEEKLANVRGSKASMIFQDPMTSLNPTMRIGRQIEEMILQHNQMSRAESRKRALELLSLVGIPEPERRYGQYPHQFSGGMRQRIVIAIAVANNPELLLADEPTTALDVTIQSQIFRLIKNIQTEFGTAMILITHDLGLVAGIADRIIVMYGGRIVEEGSTDQIFYNPLHPYTVGLLNAVPRLSDTTDTPLRTIEGLPPVLKNPRDACSFAERCPNAMKICRQKQPHDFQPVKDNRAACWLHHPSASALRDAFLSQRFDT